MEQGVGGTASHETRRALAAVFDVDVASLRVDNVGRIAWHRQGVRLGGLGVALGALLAGAAIVYSTVRGDTSPLTAGYSFGLLGASAGVLHGVIGWLSGRLEKAG